MIQTLADLRDFAARFLDEQPSGTICGLSGELGLGKTEFVRQIAVLLSEKKRINAPRIQSPSFVYFQSYPDLKLFHFDFYRLDKVSSRDLEELGFIEAREKCLREGGYLFVEWPERAQIVELGLDKFLEFSWEGQDRVIRRSRLGTQRQNPSSPNDH